MYFTTTYIAIDDNSMICGFNVQIFKKYLKANLFVMAFFLNLELSVKTSVKQFLTTVFVVSDIYVMFACYYHLYIKLYYDKILILKYHV